MKIVKNKIHIQMLAFEMHASCTISETFNQSIIKF